VSALPPSRPSWGDRLAAVRRIDWSQQYAQAKARTELESAPPSRRPRLDVTSWGGAAIAMLAVAAVLWIVQIVNVADHYGLDRFGLRPRTAAGLWGVLTEPFLHSSWGHLLSNTIAFILIGGAVLLGGVRAWLIATAIIVVVGGLLTWLIAPTGVIVGASGLIFGWLGYLIARAYFSRRLRWIVAAFIVVAFFSGLLSGLVPNYNTDVSWQSHLCGFAAGILAGALLHPRRRRAPAPA
jgi:membrane associated rhomboid family serine protease